MSIQNPFTAVEILPSYTLGFAFSWDIMPTFSDSLPWTFTVQEGPTTDGPWVDTATVQNVAAFIEQRRRLYSKENVLFFRIKLKTGRGEYYSHVKTPYGDLDRREYLLVREMMRKESLQMQGLSGINAKLWIRSTFGPRCTVCRDPITNDVLRGDCPVCFGTGRAPGYHGPYCVCCTFSTVTRDSQMPEDGTGTREPVQFSVRMLGFPYAKGEDVLIDPRQDKRYYVDAVETVMEVRRIRVVQQLTVREVPLSDPIQKLGAA